MAGSVSRERFCSKCVVVTMDLKLSPRDWVILAILILMIIAGHNSNGSNSTKKSLGKIDLQEITLKSSAISSFGK